MENLIELEECPCCRGNGVISHEGGWNVQVECADCGSLWYNIIAKILTMIK